MHKIIERSQQYLPPNVEMKVSDLIADYLKFVGISKVFTVTGGCVVHILDSLSKIENIHVVPVLHEQSAAMAADAFSRLRTDSFGLAVATSGPGATNLLTGVCCSYYDSIPTLMITGQVPSNQLRRNSGSRQIGFQETDVVSIYKPVTKSSVLVDKPVNILKQLDIAIFQMFSDRPGPCLLDICDDVQRAIVNPSNLPRFNSKSKGFKTNRDSQYSKKISKKKLKELVRRISESQRPILIFGAGIRFADGIKQAQTVCKSLQLPYLVTWGAFDFFDHNDPLFCGIFGVTSSRAGNFIVQNSDLVLAIGTRLDTHEIGNLSKEFAPDAIKVLVDIDKYEIKKFKSSGLALTLDFSTDANEFLNNFLLSREQISLRDLSKWYNYINIMRVKYPSCSDKDINQPSLVNPYYFMEVLSKNLRKDAIVITDGGSNLIWTMQGLKLHSNENRVISAWNHSPMGYALPASMGAAFAQPEKQIICIIGDGGLQMNVQELATIHRNNLNIKIFVLNNHCHGIIQGTQNQWLNGNHVASSPLTGLPDPDHRRICEAYGITTLTLDTHLNLDQEINKFLSNTNLGTCVIEMKPESQIYPKLLPGKPLHEMNPPIPKEELNQNLRFFSDKYAK